MRNGFDRYINPTKMDIGLGIAIVAVALVWFVRDVWALP